jgi:poly-gamma-glutamate synthase PgsB/CapB
MLIEIISSGTLLALLIIYYYLEFKRITSIKEKIGVRIAVTGSRGKSTTVKFLCALFQSAGYSVLGKVTGTKPLLILPNGQTEIIKRKGIVSILEQKKILLKRANEIKPDMLITEIMSVTPEYQKVETQLMITPHYYVITNIKNDHIGVTGNDKKEICNVFLSSAPKKTKILTLEEERPLFQSTKFDTEEIVYLKKIDDMKNVEKSFFQPGFEQTIRFAIKFCQEFGISRKVLSSVISNFRFDEEVYFVKKIKKNNIIVNAFSANDVESTQEIYEKLKRDYSSHKKVAIFCTRADKPERTSSWIQALRKQDWEFDNLYVFGPHFNSIRWHTYPFPVKRLDKNKLSELMENGKNTLFFGFGNYVNSGQKIVDFWNRMET